jgi:hypothetical protein
MGTPILVDTISLMTALEAVVNAAGDNYDIFRTVQFQQRNDKLFIGATNGMWMAVWCEHVASCASCGMTIGLTEAEALCAVLKYTTDDDILLDIENRTAIMQGAELTFAPRKDGPDLLKVLTDHKEGSIGSILFGPNLLSKAVLCFPQTDAEDNSVELSFGQTNVYPVIIKKRTCPELTVALMPCVECKVRANTDDSNLGGNSQ